HGAIPSITPTGSRSAIARVPGLSEGMTSPEICVVREAASRTMLAARPRLNIAHPAVAPISPIIASTNWVLRASSAAAAFIRTARRAFGPMADHVGKAAAARAAMAGTSAAFMASDSEATSPVIGLMRLNFIGPLSLLSCARFRLVRTRPMPERARCAAGKNVLGMTERRVALYQISLVEEIADSGDDLPAVVDAELDRGLAH